MQPAEHQPKMGAIKKNTAKKSNRVTVPNAPKRVPANPRGTNQNAQLSQTRVGDLLKMNVAVNSKRDAQAAMKIAKQLEAEARKYLGPPATNQRQQQQHQRIASRPQQRQAAPQRHAPQQHMQQRRAPYSVAQASHWPEPQTENFLADHDRMSDRDSEQIDMDDDMPDLKPNLASLQAQANQFARGVRGQVRSSYVSSLSCVVAVPAMTFNLSCALQTRR
jgi:hypothetical protein